MTCKKARIIRIYFCQSLVLSLSLLITPPPHPPHTQRKNFFFSVSLLTFVPLVHPVSHHRNKWQQWPGRRPESFEYIFVSHLSSLSLSSNPPSPTSTPHTDRISLSQSSSPRLSPSPTPRLTIEPGDSNDLKEGQHHERQSGSIVVNKSEEPQTSLPHTHTHTHPLCYSNPIMYSLPWNIA